MSDKIRIGEDGKDPLLNGPEPARVLFKRIGREADGFSHDDVIGACASTILVALRQTYSKRKEADEALTRLLERARSRLDDHYFSNGDRRSIFPFDQHLFVTDDILEHAKPYNRRRR